MRLVAVEWPSKPGAPWSVALTRVGLHLEHEPMRFVGEGLYVLMRDNISAQKALV